MNQGARVQSQATSGKAVTQEETKCLPLISQANKTASSGFTKRPANGLSPLWTRVASYVDKAITCLNAALPAQMNKNDLHQWTEPALCAEPHP